MRRGVASRGGERQGPPMNSRAGTRGAEPVPGGWAFRAGRPMSAGRGCGRGILGGAGGAGGPGGRRRGRSAGQRVAGPAAELLPPPPPGGEWPRAGARAAGAALPFPFLPRPRGCGAVTCVQTSPSPGVPLGRRVPGRRCERARGSRYPAPSPRSDPRSDPHSSPDPVGSVCPAAAAVSGPVADDSPAVIPSPARTSHLPGASRSFSGCVRGSARAR